MDKKSRDNLVPRSQRTKSEQREIAKKGGVASGKKRRERKTLKEELLAILNTKKNGKTVQEMINLQLANQAMQGNVKAYEVIRDTIGEKAIDKHDFSGNVGLVQIMDDLESQTNQDDATDNTD